MIGLDFTTEVVLQNISRLIVEGNTSGYYPYWELSFGDFYRSWHLSDANIELIAQSVLLKNKEGFISEIVDGKRAKIHWVIKIEE